MKMFQNPCGTRLAGGVTLKPHCENSFIKKGSFSGNFGFTLAETLIVLVVLGIIAAITIPSLIARQVEASKKTKIKKAMTVYDYAVNKMVVENNLKSDAALTEWAGENCSNSAAYFKIAEKLSEDTSCVFRTSDGLYWDISDIENPIVAQTEDDLTKMQNGEDAGTNAFRMSAWFEDNGSFRVNDLNASTNTKDELTRLYNYINNIKIETKPICRKTLTCDGTYCTKLAYDSNGNIVIEYSCDGNGNNCGYSNKYEYDSNGNKTAFYAACDVNGNDCRYKSEYDSNGHKTSYYWDCKNGTCSGLYKYKYDSSGNETIYSSCDGSGNNCTSSWTYEYDGSGNQITTHMYCDGSGKNCGNSSKYEYDDSGNMIAEYSCDGSGNICSSSQKYEYDDSGNMIAEYYCDGSGNNCPLSDKYEYDSNGNKIADYYYCDGNGNNCSRLSEYKYDNNGNLIVLNSDCTIDGSNCWDRYTYQYECK